MSEQLKEIIVNASSEKMEKNKEKAEVINNVIDSDKL